MSWGAMKGIQFQGTRKLNFVIVKIYVALWNVKLGIEKK